jgi:hypothetical protein
MDRDRVILKGNAVLTLQGTLQISF